MAGMRLELESQPDADGNTTTEIYEILSNTVNEITTTTPFTRTPVAGDTVRIAGIPAYWRSNFEHFGLPHQHKTMMDFSLGYMDRVNPDGVITVSVGSGEYPTVFDLEETATLDKYRKKFTIAKTAVFFMYEFANSVPDELFVITNYEREVDVVPARRKA